MSNKRTLTKKQSEKILETIDESGVMGNEDKINSVLDLELKFLLIARYTSLVVEETQPLQENTFISVRVPYDNSFITVSVGKVKTGPSSSKLTYGVIHR